LASPEDQIVEGGGASRKRGPGNLVRTFADLNSKFQFLVVVLAVAIVGIITLLFSLAATVNLATSTSPNDVILQYSLPHIEMAVSNSNVATPMPIPFTLYGNGLLICGSSNNMPNMPDMPAPDPGLLTATMLNKNQIHSLLQQVSNTGFFNLNKEYYKLPVVEQQDIVRVSLKSGDYYVLYYNDVPAPAAYTSTVKLLTSTCKGVNTPYIPQQAKLHVKKGATLMAGQAAVAPAALDSTIQPIIQNGLASADIAQKQSPSLSDGTSPGEAVQTESGSTANVLVKGFKSHSRQYVQQNNVVYEAAVEQTPPKVKNPLKINYAAIRKQQKQSGLGAKLRNVLSPTAYAAGGVPVRVVLFLPSDGGTTDTLAQAQALGQAEHDWYCGQVGACYNYQGVQVIRGSQTQAFYMTCHTTGCTDPLSAVLRNAYQYDQGTLYGPDVDTLLVTGWSTGAIKYGVCGYGFIADNLGVVDLHEPNITSGGTHNCQPGHDMAHESGHTFGLNHTGNGTLMDGPPYAQYSPFCDIGSSLEPTCSLDRGQAAQLHSETQFFSDPAGVNVTTELTTNNGVTATNMNGVTVAVEPGATYSCAPLQVVSNPIAHFACVGTLMVFGTITPPAGYRVCACSTIKPGYGFPIVNGAVSGNIVIEPIPPPPPPPPPDTTAPSVPANVRISSFSQNVLIVTWTPATDNPGGNGIAGYHVYQNGTLVASPSGNVYSRKISGTADYETVKASSFKVSAYDISGNESAAVTASFGN
jgi:hypothetical protein